MSGQTLSVIHLFGASTSAFHHDLSRLYAEAVIRPEGTVHAFVEVRPDGGWRIGPEIDALGPAMGVTEAMRHLPPADLVVPHMFCPAGMTSYRALFEDLLGVPVVGAPADVAGLAMRKGWTRDVLAAAGLAVPEGGPVRDGVLPADLPLPCVVKPDREDNSRGLSIVRDRAEAPAAIAAAAEFGDVIAERFVPGREVRVGVIERAGALHVPALIEYPVDADTPVRAVGDKLDLSDAGTPLAKTDRAAAQPTCPAEIAPGLAAEIAAAARSAHRALGARHYSLFDIRIEAGTDRPVILEAGLFWSFSRLSAITEMLVADGENVPHIIGTLWRDAAAKGDRRATRAQSRAVHGRPSGRRNR